MRRVLLILSLLFGTTLLARAEPAPAKPASPPGKVPMMLVPCLPASDELRLVSLDGTPVVCWGTTCMKLAEGEPPAMVAAPPDRPARSGPRAEVVDRDGKPQVCLAADCTPLGTKLAARIAKERKRAASEKARPHLAATQSRKIVVVSDEAWDVASDKRLKLKRPASYSSKEDTPNLMDVVVVGNLLVTSWSNCAGPCTVSQLVDDSGKNRGPSLAGGGDLFQLDDKRFVIASEYAEIHVFDLAGKRLGHLELFGEPNAASVVALDEGTIGVLRRDGDDAHRLTVVQALEDSRLRLGSERFLPTCAP